MPSYVVKVPLTAAQKTQLSNITAGGTRNFAQGYEYVYSLMKGNPAADANLLYWFQQAPQINRGTGASSDFIRTNTAIGMKNAGLPPQNLQEISNDIAKAVITDIISNSGVADLSYILGDDIRVAFDHGVPGLGGWGGSFYYWNVLARDPNGNAYLDSNGNPLTVGQKIMSDPAQLSLFENTLGQSIASMINEHPLESAWSGISTLFSSNGILARINDLPVEVQNRVMDVAGDKSPLVHIWLTGHGLTLDGDAAVPIAGLDQIYLGDNPTLIDFSFSADPTADAAQVNSFAAYASAVAQESARDSDGRLSLTSFMNALKSIGNEFTSTLSEIGHYASAADLAQQFGSSLGRALTGNDLVTGTISGSLLGVVAMNVGQMIDANNGLSVNVTATDGSIAPEIGLDANQVWNDFPNELRNFTTNAAIGSVSSYLTMEFGNLLGAKGFGAEMFGAGVSPLLQHVLTNLASNVPGLSYLQPQVSADFSAGSAVASSMAAFFGSKLGSLIVQPQTEAGVVLSSLSSSVGSMVATDAFGALGWSAGTATEATSGLIGQSAAWFGNTFGRLIGGFAFTGVGALVGFVIGALIGNLFGAKKPKIPTADAEVYLQLPSAYYALGSVTESNGGNLDLVEKMGIEARDALNGVIRVITGNDVNATVANTSSPSQWYGHTGGQLWVATGTESNKINVDSPDEAVDKGIMYALPATMIIGGDPLMKRAAYNLVRNPAQDANFEAFGGDLQVAEDYGYYLRNRGMIDALIAQPWEKLTQAQKDFYNANKAFITRAAVQNSVALSADDEAFYTANQAMVDGIISAMQLTPFAAGWIATLDRASELNLDKWAPSDFYGGLGGFIESFNPGEHNVFFDDMQVSLAGGSLTISDPTTATAGFFYLPSASTDGRSITITDFANAGLGYSDWSATNLSGNNFLDDSGATSSQTIDDYAVLNGVAYTGGNDIALGSAYGDTMQGRTGDDWLDGGAGNDVVHGGQDDDVLNGGAGDDLLYGDKGNDFLSGGSGNDSLHGVDGNDTLSGKGGADYMYGEAGDDVFMVNADGGATYDYMDGGDASDTISYERFSGAPLVNFNLASGSYYGDQWVNIENVTGSADGDQITGTSGDNVLRGLGGNDSLDGSDGNDTLEGGAGADSLTGGAGLNTLSYANSSLGALVDLGYGTAAGGDAEGDVFAGFSNIIGSQFADNLAGDANTNYLQGLGGSDWFTATAGADTYDGGADVDAVDYSASTSGVQVDLGSTSDTVQAAGYGSAGMAAGQTLIAIEQVVGSAYDDTLSGEAGDQTFVGGAGNDLLTGGADGDTYVLGPGDGADTVTDDGSGNNVISLVGVSYSDLWFATDGTPGTGYLEVGIRNSSDKIHVSNNFNLSSPNSNVIKSINIEGAGQIDIGSINYAVEGSDAADFLAGDASHADLLIAHDGDDQIHGAWNGSADYVESNGNVIIGGRGNDYIYTSEGDDEFAFERGDGIDVINDTGGEDSISFGPNVEADDVIYEVNGGDLYIGIKDLNNTALTASQVSDHIRVVDGGTKVVDEDTGTRKLNTIEFVNAGGATVDLRKLDINWTIQFVYSGGGTPLKPIVLDLNNQGLELSSVLHTPVAIRDDDGRISQVSWVGPTNALLAVDRNGDGKVDRASEISFSQDAPGATSDLEGLRAWDSNGDGVLNKLDDGWSKLLVWTDSDQNGQSSRSELQTLDQAGVTSIDLKGQATGDDGSTTFDSYVQNTLSVDLKDGSTVTGYDVALAHHLLGATGEDFSAIKGDGVFGGLSNDPLAVAKAAGNANPTYADLAALAQVDFLNDGPPNQRGLAMWKSFLDPKKKPKPFGGMDGAENLPVLQHTVSGEKPSQSAGMAQQPSTELSNQPQPSAEFQTSIAPTNLTGAVPMNLASPGGFVLRSAADALPIDPPESWEPTDERSSWWMMQEPTAQSAWACPATLADFLDDDYESAAAMRPSLSNDPSAGASINQLHQEQLLRQATANFGAAEPGGAAAWLRGAEATVQTSLATGPRLPQFNMQRLAA